MMDEAQLAVKIVNDPSEEAVTPAEVITGGRADNPIWAEYLIFFNEATQPHIKAIREAIENGGLVGVTADHFCNDHHFEFSDGARIAFTWRAWGDLMQASARATCGTICRRRGIRMSTTVVHCKKESYDTYIGRPSKWGNLFQIGRDGNRYQVVQQHAHWIAQPAQYQLFMSIGTELKDKSLGCYCAPKLCHGHVYAAIADGRANILTTGWGDHYLDFTFYMCEDCEAYIPFGPKGNGVLVYDGTLKTVCSVCATKYNITPNGVLR